MTINIISEYTPIVGGGGVLAEELVKRLLKKGHRVNVITWGKPIIKSKAHPKRPLNSAFPVVILNLVQNLYRSRIKCGMAKKPELFNTLHPNLTIYRVGQLSKISPLQKLKFGYLAGKKAKELKGIVHGHTFFFPLDKKRTIYTFHATQYGIMRALQRTKDKSAPILISIMLKKLYLIWEKYIIKNSFRLIAVSHTVKNELLELGAKSKQVEVMFNTINLKNYYRASPKIVKQLRVKYALDPNTKFVFAIGRLSPIKGFQDLIKSIGLFKKQKIKLLIAGEGEYEQTLKQLVKKLKLTRQVIFLGKIPKEETKKFYSFADVTVVPSLYDAFGLVVLEAMACGSPLVCTNVCNFPLIAGRAALYTQPQNPEDLAEKIQYILNHPKKAKKMIEYGLKKVKNYTWEPYTKKLEGIYQSLSSTNNEIVE